MSFFHFPLIIVFFTSCFSIPNGKIPHAQKMETNSEEKVQLSSLTLQKNYSQNPEIFTFYLWPNNLSREDLKKTASNVSQMGAELEEIYAKLLLLQRDYDLIKKQIPLPTLEPFIRSLCLEGKLDSEGCSLLESNQIEIPMDCESLYPPPWMLDFSLEEDCQKVFDDYPGKDKREQARTLKEQQTSLAQSSFQTIMGQIQNELGDDPFQLELWKNWKDTKAEEVLIPGLSQNGPSLWSFALNFNPPGQIYQNTILYSEKRGNLKVLEPFYLDKQVPTIKIRIYEEGWFPVSFDRVSSAEENRERRSTGYYYDILFRRSELYFGMRLLGEVEKFHLQNPKKVLARGVTWILFKEEIL